MAAKQGFRIKSLVPPVVVVAALSWLSTVDVELPDVFVAEQIIELRDRFYDIAIPDDQEVWAVGKNGKIVRSDDRGETFRVQPTPTINHLHSIAAWDTQTAVVIGNEGETLHTADGGASWQSVPAPLGDFAKKMFRAEIAPDGRVWATAEYGSILSSTDKGETWALVSGGDDVAWNDVAFARDGRVCVAGEFGQIGCSDDQGETWVAKETPLDSSLMAIAFNESGHGLAAGVDGEEQEAAGAPADGPQKSYAKEGGESESESVMYQGGEYADDMDGNSDAERERRKEEAARTKDLVRRGLIYSPWLLLDELIDEGPAARAEDLECKTPSRCLLVRTLVLHGADPNFVAPMVEHTPLHWLAYHGDHRAIKEYLWLNSTETLATRLEDDEKTIEQVEQQRGAVNLFMTSEECE